ncbi:MAG: hypothetical protein DMF13_02315 [Verrucomicrobia bacterium]|nr:MAG: hypothetical protein DMF13_02315 [Verrucomicrobiota bacterium]
MCRYGEDALAKLDASPNAYDQTGARIGGKNTYMDVRLTVVLRIFAAGTLIYACDSGSARNEEEAWSTCSTPITRFVLQIPASLIHSTAPTATGCSFQTPDGEFNVEAVVQLDSGKENETLESRMQKEIDLLPGTVKHKKKGDSWFLLSGVTPDGTEYYRKLFIKDSQCVTLRVTYPQAQHKKYDQWVARIEKTFVPFAVTEEKSGD